MTLYVDTANLVEMEEVLARGVARGITTNPTLVSKEQSTTYGDFLYNVILVAKRWNCPVSIELTSSKPWDMTQEAAELKKLHAYNGMVIKVPIGWDELTLISQLVTTGVPVNVTAVMSYDQAILAAEAGADYISLFWNRILDYGDRPNIIVSKVRGTLERSNSHSRIIVGSIRKQSDIGEALQAGAHIVTVPYRFFQPMSCHPKTDEVVAQFLGDFAAWQKT